MIRVHNIADNHAFRYTPAWDLRAALHLRPRSNSSESWSSGNVSLGRRQDGSLDGLLPPQMDDYCVWRCSIATCGCNSRSSVAAVTRRWDLEFSNSQSMSVSIGPLGRWNQSALVDYRSFDRRGSRLVARFPVEPAKNGQFTRAELDAYLPTRLTGDDDFFTTNEFLTVCCYCI